MDLKAIEASAGTFLLTVSGVAVYLRKYGPKAYRALKLLDSVIIFSEDLIESAKDDTLTPEEIKKLQDDAKAFRQSYNELKAE